MKPSACMQPGEAAVYQKMNMEQLAACKMLPLNMLECLEKGDRTSKDCALAYARYQGQVVSLPMAEGPALAWSFDLDSPLRSLLPMGDGTWLVRQDKAILAIGPGRQLWKTKLAASSSNLLADLGGGVVLASADDRTLVALDALTGQQRWKTQALQEDVRAVFTLSPGSGTGTELLLANGAWMSLHPADCRKGAPGCVRPTGADIGEAIFANPEAVFHTETSRTFFTSKHLVQTDAKGKLIFRIDARDKFSGAVPHEDKQLLLSGDGWIFALDPLLCRSETPIFLTPRTPKPKTMEELDLDHAAPPGCIIWRTPVSTPMGGHPLSLGDKGLVLQIRDHLVKFESGKFSWRVGVAATGTPAITKDGRIFVLSKPLDKRDHPGLRCLSGSTGLTLWRTALGTEWLPGLSRAETVGVTINGPWLLAYAGRHIAAIDLRVPPKPLARRP
ncbi:MAG: PQQ-binding-like beta-propeller repeat protein [Deltaproteobacteria bacterium]|nr:PQQ-binding-like beta-propeller repeat protein [Deltaproteobacteria bacterium]